MQKVVPSLNKGGKGGTRKQGKWFLSLAFCLLPFAFSCSRSHPRVVVVYASQDQVYAEPILQEFTRETGIEVKAIYDSEAVKTVGLVQRLLAEKAHHRCDLFWNNEELRTRQLASLNLFREARGWEAFGFRTRCLVFNTNYVKEAAMPSRLSDLTNTVWKGRLALAYPLFGTTATHFMALHQKWGDESWHSWVKGLQANQPFLVDGNSVVVKLVGQGEAWIGLTDSDDIANGQSQGLPIRGVVPVDGRFEIRNTIAILRNAPHPAEAQELWDFLLRPQTAGQLVRVQALSGITPSDDQSSTEVNWPDLLTNLEARTMMLKKVFLR